MKRILFILMALALLNGTVHAQRLLPSQKGLELTGGIPIQKKGMFKDKGFTFSINGMQYIKGFHYYHFGVNFMQQEYRYDNWRLPMRDYLADGGFMCHLFSTPGKYFLIYAGAYATLGYEEANDGERWLPDGAYLNARNRFVYGGGIQLSLEGFITDHLVIFTRAKGHFLGGTDLDLFRPALNFGIRIMM